MTNSYPLENTPEIIYVKEQLYKLFFELESEVKGEKKELDEQEYEETILNSKIESLIHYIKETTNLLIKKKTQKHQNLVQRNLNKAEVYENKLQKYENDIRGYVKSLFQYKIQCEALEMKLEAYMEMEQDFEEMKEKLKYEEGTFLDNDRKDNEILILRAENSNLKKVIGQLEKDKVNFEEEKQNDKKMISLLKNQIEKLAKKVSRLEQNQKESNSSNSGSINININNNTNAPAKFVINHENEYTNNREGNNCIMNSNMFNSTYSRILNDFSTNTKSTKNLCSSASSKKDKNMFSPTQKKPHHHKTKSVSMSDNEKKAELMSKYFASHYQTNNSTKSSMTKLNSNYVKMVPTSSKAANKNTPSSNKNYKANNFNGNPMISSLSKMYMPNSKGNKSANRTMVSVRSSSRLGEHF